ncbi:MAG TPA: WD40 repeat domain-containing protein [Planctomycetota bacterium]|nr:WD40 repeat domain-containing protein [Planctomycetota bacterium]
MGLWHAYVSASYSPLWRSGARNTGAGFDSAGNIVAAYDDRIIRIFNPELQLIRSLVFNDADSYDWMVVRGKYAIFTNGPQQPGTCVVDLLTGMKLLEVDDIFCEVSHVNTLLVYGKGSVRSIDLASGQQLWEFKSAYTRDLYAKYRGGDWLGVMGGDDLLTVLNVKTGTVAASISAPFNKVRDFGINADGSRVFTIDIDTTLWMYELPSGNQVASTGKLSANSAFFSPDGRALITIISGAELHDANTGRKIKDFNPQHTGGVWYEVELAKGDLLTVAGQGVRQYDFKTQTEQFFSVDHNTTYFTAVSPDRSRLISRFRWHTFDVWTRCGSSDFAWKRWRPQSAALKVYFFNTLTALLLGALLYSLWRDNRAKPALAPAAAEAAQSAA